jgi:hypothetical protein
LTSALKIAVSLRSMLCPDGMIILLSHRHCQ